MKYVLVPLVASVAVLPCGAAEPYATENPNRFEARALLGFGVRSSIGGIGNLPGSDPAPQGQGGGIDRNYDDGFVRVDSEGNAGGLTWYWGYNHAAQVPGDGTLRFHSLSARGDGQISANQEAPALGTEVSWLRDLRRGHSWSFGTKLAFGYTGYEFKEAAQSPSVLRTLTDTYSLGGIVPPGDPSQGAPQYQGSFDLPGPVIGELPATRTVLTSPVLTSGDYSLDANLWSFKAGSWIELPLGERFAAQFGAGLAFAVVSAELRYEESYSGGEASDLSYSGTQSSSQVVFGGYLEAQIRYSITERVAFTAAAQFSPLTSYNETLASRSVEIEFGTAWAVNLGFSVRF